MSNAPNDNLSQGAPQWMRDIFEELKDMFEELFPDADKLNLEEIAKRRLGLSLHTKRVSLVRHAAMATKLPNAGSKIHG